jgi:Uma2 family endonuclease
MVTMTAAKPDLPSDRPLTIDDLYLLPDDSSRYELDEGVLVVSAAPAIDHQLVVFRLAQILAEQAAPEFVVLPGVALEISPFQVRVPDLVVVHLEDVVISDKSVVKPPALAVEVASPSTARYDRSRKKEVYASYGIGAYWIVTPSLHQPAVSVFERRHGEYRLMVEAIDDEPVKLDRPFRCELTPAALIAGPWRR